MSKIKILTDTSCGMLREEVESLGYEMIALPFMIDEQEYDEESIKKEEFYDKIRGCNSIHTSQASIELLKNKLDELLLENEYVIYLPITSGLSGSYESANALLSDEKYKNRVVCIDHKTISVLQRSMIEDIVKMLENNVELSTIKEKIENNAKNNRIYIAVESLDYLKKGGRINPLVATIGNLLNIKPILFSNGGKFDVIKKVRSMKTAEESLIELVKNDLNEIFNDEDISHFSIGVAYTECLDEAMKLKKEVEDTFGVKVVFDELPMVIGCHVGPGVVATAIYKRVNEC